jgi:hypothetical protein
VHCQSSGILKSQPVRRLTPSHVRSHFTDLETFARTEVVVSQENSVLTGCPGPSQNLPQRVSATGQVVLRERPRNIGDGGTQAHQQQ